MAQKLQYHDGGPNLGDGPMKGNTRTVLLCCCWEPKSESRAKTHASRSSVSPLLICRAEWGREGTTGTLNGNSGSKLLGIFCGLGSCFCFALWLIIQAQMSIEFPSHLSSTALMSLMGAIQATVFALCVEKDWSQWRLGWSIRLLTAAYSSKEMKKVTDLETTLELEEIEVVVTSTAAADHDKCMRSNDSYTCSSKSNNKIVGKDHDNASKREHEGQDNENN
ncbi:hypothetical protein JHK87_021643 [Glycine soja]|nr:hypothetical protein JHK87_021643 [Glycine soja]